MKSPEPNSSVEHSVVPSIPLPDAADVRLWMDTANYSGARAVDLSVDADGSVSGYWLLGNPGRPMKVEDFLYGRYFAATYHREKSDAIEAQRRRVTRCRDLMNQQLAS